MTKLSLTLLALFSFTFPSLAQTAPTPFTPPPNQGIVAKLTTDLDVTKAKPGDTIQAQVTHDLKNGHDTLLKKGSTITGKIAKVQPFSSSDPSMIVILFDQISPAGGAPQALNARIGALAPPPGIQTETIQDGRGMAQSNINSASNGDKDVSNVPDLAGGSVGVHGIRGVTLASTIDAGKLYSIIKSTSGDLKLKKNSQIVLNMPE
jgi:hypothetical protein